MENILPFLLAMAALAYKIYDNFKQEQEKAKKRNTGAPDQAMPQYPAAPPSREVPVREIEPKPVVVKEEYFPQHPYEPQYKTVFRETPPAKTYREPVYHRPKAEPLRVMENINPEVPAEEVRRTRAIHKPHQHKVVLHTEDRFQHPYANFDLHDAVVKEAILNRPQF